MAELIQEVFSHLLLAQCSFLSKPERRDGQTSSGIRLSMFDCFVWLSPLHWQTFQREGQAGAWQERGWEALEDVIGQRILSFFQSVCMSLTVSMVGAIAYSSLWSQKMSTILKPGPPGRNYYRVNMLCPYQ